MLFPICYRNSDPTDIAVTAAGGLVGEVVQVWKPRELNTRQIECVSLLPSLVVHHHLTKVILIGIISISQILSLVIGILNNFE